jgi:hypothetical protein
MRNTSPTADPRLRNATSVRGIFVKKMKIVIYWAENVKYSKNKISRPKLKNCAKLKKRE